jgi:phosphoribulokinase
VIKRTWIEVITAFNAASTNLLTMGYGAIGAGTADDYVDTVTEGTPAVYPGVVTAPIAALTAETDVYLYYTPTGTAATTGKAICYVEWVRIATA